MLVCALILSAGWAAWFTLARVPVYETSSKARLEVLRATYPVETPVAGRVIEIRVTLDKAVTEGDILARLDDSTERSHLDEARVRIAGIAPQVKALRTQSEADQRALAAFEAQLASQLAETQSRVDEISIAREASQVEAARSERLYSDGLMSDGDRRRARAEAERASASQMTAQAQLERQRREATTGAEDRKSRIVAFEREAATLAAELSSLEASLPALEYAVELRTIRAPATGRVGELAGVRVGQVLSEASHLATIVAPGDLRVIASLAPTSFGRVRRGQSARVRLDAFPWTEYGVLRATVTDVAQELHDGEVRIELTVDSSGTRIPLQHGLPGRVDVTIEESTPMRLILRSAGTLGA